FQRGGRWLSSHRVLHRGGNRIMLIVPALSSPPSHRTDRVRQRELSAPSCLPAPAMELLGTPISFARNAEIYGEGEPADHLYTVTSGIVRTCKFLVDGRRQIGAFYFPGDTFGLETSAQHEFSAEAVADVDILAAKSGAAATSQPLALMACELQRAQHHVLLL